MKKDNNKDKPVSDGEGFFSSLTEKNTKGKIPFRIPAAMASLCILLTSCQVYTPAYTGSSAEVKSTMGETSSSASTAAVSAAYFTDNTPKTEKSDSSASDRNSVPGDVSSNTSNSYNASNASDISGEVSADPSLTASSVMLPGASSNTSSPSSSAVSIPSGVSTPSAIDKMDDASFKKSMEKRAEEGQEVLRRKKEETIREWTDKIIPGTTIGGIDVEGLTKDEAIEKVNSELLNPIMEKKIYYSVDKVDQDLSYEDLEVSVKESVFDDAVSFGKDIDTEELIKLIEDKKGPELTPELTFNEGYLRELTGKYAERVRNDSISKSVEYDGETVTVKSNAKEKKMDTEAFVKAIKERINLDPEDTQSFEASIKEVPTTLKDSDLKSITTELTRYSTDYSWSPEGRKANVELASKNLDNILVMPGAEFSFNRMVGPQTKANGFKDSLVYLGSKMVEEPGGGVCQVSTTLYNSLLLAGIDPTMRSNHGMVISYAPMGLDATVAEPVLDFKFRNIFDKPILIKTEFNGSELTFIVLGSEDAMKGYSYSYDTEVVNHIPWKSETIEDPEYPRGYAKTETTPFDGYEVKVFKTTYKDGNEVKKELYHEDKYSVVNEVTRIGTGDPSEKTWPDENTETTVEAGTGEDTGEE